MSEPAAYHPERSRVSQEKLADFLRAPTEGNLQEVPGIGDVGEKKLKEAGITTTFSLMGKYLMLKDEGVGTVENADRMYYFLQSIDYPAGFRAGVVHAIAEKLNIKFPGIYDADAYSS